MDLSVVLKLLKQSLPGGRVAAHGRKARLQPAVLQQVLWRRGLTHYSAMGA